MAPVLSRRDFLHARAAATTLLAIPSEASAATIASGDLRADIALFRRAYSALHPGLYRYNTPAGMGDRFDRLAHWASSPPTTAECYAAFARLTSSVRCGHSYANFYNQSRTLAASLFAAHDRLPVHFDWIRGRMVVLRDFSGSAMPPSAVPSRVMSPNAPPKRRYGRSSGRRTASRGSPCPAGESMTANGPGSIG